MKKFTVIFELDCNNMLSQNSISPAILTYVTIILALLIFVSRRRINSEKMIIAISSFLFISSGFFVQILVSRYKDLQHFFEDWEKILSSPPVTVLATASGIFIGNTFLKLISDEKQRKEIAIILINGLEAHVRSLSTINLKLSTSNIDTAKIQIYLTKVRENKSYEKALTEIGKFRDNETDLISKYESHLWTTLIDIESKLNDSNVPILYSQLKIIATATYAILCSCVLAHKYLPTQVKNQEQFFLRDFHQLTQWLLNEQNQIVQLPTVVRRGFVEVLIDIKRRYQSLNISNTRSLGQVYTLCILYLPLTTLLAICEKELVVFGTSIDEVNTKAKQHIISEFGKTEQEAEQAMQHSQSEMLLPCNLL